MYYKGPVEVYFTYILCENTFIRALFFLQLKLIWLKLFVGPYYSSITWEVNFSFELWTNKFCFLYGEKWSTF